MLFQTLALFNFDHGQPVNSLDLTGAFGPFSVAAVIGLGVAILAVAALTAVVDSWRLKRQAEKLVVTLKPEKEPVEQCRKESVEQCQAA